MQNNDISILVIDRNLGKEGLGADYHTLTEEIKALESCGYRVDVVQNVTEITTAHKIIIAHPHWRDVDYLQEFHREHPEIPIIIYSVMYPEDQTKRVRGLKGYLRDTDGIYIKKIVASMDDLLHLVKRLSQSPKKN